MTLKFCIFNIWKIILLFACFFYFLMIKKSVWRKPLGPTVAFEILGGCACTSTLLHLNIELSSLGMGLKLVNQDTSPSNFANWADPERHLFFGSFSYKNTHKSKLYVNSVLLYFKIVKAKQDMQFETESTRIFLYNDTWYHYGTTKCDHRRGKSSICSMYGSLMAGVRLLTD